MKKISTLPDITIGDARPNWPGPFRGDTDGGQRLRDPDEPYFGEGGNRHRGGGIDGS